MTERNWITVVPNVFQQLLSIAMTLSGAIRMAISALFEEVAAAQPSAGSSKHGVGSSVLEEVAVTAIRRSDSIQDVPMSTSAVSQAEKAGGTRVEGIVYMVGSLGGALRIITNRSGDGEQ